jgi:hypothetical protein
MLSLLSSLGALLILFAAPAKADERPVTEEERAKLLSSISAEGCSGGKMEFEDGEYEVEDVKCSDGRTYELKFDAGFRLINKKPEN